MVMGHSVGEIVAATVAGMITMEDGLMIMRERGRLMSSLPRIGVMASLMAGETEVAKALEPYRDRVSIAALNGPESTVISGERAAVQALRAEWSASPEQGKFGGVVRLLGEHNIVIVEIASGPQNLTSSRKDKEEKEAGFEDWLYGVGWEPQPLGETRASAHSPQRRG